jgi:hypothetical protein
MGRAVHALEKNGELTALRHEDGSLRDPATAYYTLFPFQAFPSPLIFQTTSTKARLAFIRLNEVREF